MLKTSKLDKELMTVLAAHSKRLDKLESNNSPVKKSLKKPVIEDWDTVYSNADSFIKDNAVNYKNFFTQDELGEMEKDLSKINSEFLAIHKLDANDIYICAFAGLVGSLVETLLIGIPHRSPEGLRAKPLSDWVRCQFDTAFPPEEMEKLAADISSKVPYDAQDNRNTTVRVEGLSAYYHRLLSLGHDPLLGLVVGTFDILTGRMTTIDKNGLFTSQIMENYSCRKECEIFVALAKQLRHFASDVTTSMGLPAPLMGLCNLLQFGSIGEYEQTVAEIVQGMYYEGYDFIHFCSLSIPVMMIEVITRVGYAIKRIKLDGFPISESIPFSLRRNKHPKLATMLFISHLIATGANAEKVYFTENPVAINYPEWIEFAKYSFLQLKWIMLEKREMKHSYIKKQIEEQLNSLYAGIENSFELS